MTTDTTAEAKEVELRVLRRMSPEQRLMVGLELSDQLRDVSLAGLRERHPSEPLEALILRYISLAHGVEIPHADTE